MNTKTEILIDIQKFFQEKINNSYHNPEFYLQIFEINEKHIPEVEKKEYELWLDYFLGFNYAPERIRYIENILDDNFLEEKINLINDDAFENFVIKILNTCAKLNIFEDNLEFNENAFYIKQNTLDQKLKKIIKNEIQQL